MSRSPDFLTVDDVLYIHTQQISLFGGDPSIRDQGLLASAVAQPQMTFDNQPLHAFPFHMAAAYLFHLVQNHPFVDGNKRTGLVSALAFLELNGQSVDAPPGCLYELTIGVATGRVDKPDIAQSLSRLSIATD